MDTSLKKRIGNLFENLFVVILVFYPLRHVQWGLDLADTGYNYANYTYMGTEHMDPMWLFSTWLSNGAGHLLTKLPNGGTLVGMNIYTGLFVLYQEVGNPPLGSISGGDGGCQPVLVSYGTFI